MKKVCSECGLEKDSSEFHKDRANPDGFRYECKLCRKPGHSKYDPEYHRKWKENNSEKCIRYNRIYYEMNSEKLKKYQTELRQETKEDVLSHYGKGRLQCSICGEKRIDCLSIDHVNGNGNKHRKELKKSGYHFYKWLVDNKYPEGYRTLCMNCQFIEGMKQYRGGVRKE